ncbi:MAG: EamA family transporter [Spirochaetales bacterium]|nr:EamA family transporter [Spirochaetales bacterium]
MRLRNNKILIADLMILLSALLWGGEYVVVKDMVEYMPPNWINAFRFIAAAVILYPFIRKRIKLAGAGELKAGLLLGFFMFGGFTAQTIGIQYTTAAKSGFLTSTYVIMVPFIYWLIRRSFPGIKSLVSAVLCILGISFISLDGDLGLNPGDMLTVLAAFFFSLSIIGFDYYAKKYDPLNLTFIEMLFGGLLSLVLALIFEPVPTGINWGALEIFQILYLIILGSLACHLLSNVAMKWAESSHASILWSLESVFALIFGIIFLHEGLTAQSVIGFALVFAAVIVSETGNIHIVEKVEKTGADR